jgi:hypothetical protein
MMLREDGKYVMLYEIGAWSRCVYANKGCMVNVALSGRVGMVKETCKSGQNVNSNCLSIGWNQPHAP